MQLGIRVYTLFNGKRVGKDSFGNRYYVSRFTSWDKPRRWVIYKGLEEASKAPPEWQGWLRHTLDKPPKSEKTGFKYPWQREHVPNLTGTKYAYRPQGHVLKGGKRQKATGDYEAWNPDKAA